MPFPEAASILVDSYESLIAQSVRQFTKDFDKVTSKLNKALEKSSKSQDSDDTNETDLDKFNRHREKAIEGYGQVLRQNLKQSLLEYFQDDATMDKFLDLESHETFQEFLSMINTALNNVENEIVGDGDLDLVEKQCATKLEMLKKLKHESNEQGKAVKAKSANREIDKLQEIAEKLGED